MGVAQQEQALSNLYSPALLGFFKNLFIVRLNYMIVFLAIPFVLLISVSRITD